MQTSSDDFLYSWEMDRYDSGSIELMIAATDKEAGQAAADAVIDSGLKAIDRGQRPVFWLMAAPSAFTFYSAFVERARTESRIVAMARQAEWFQFDDYPISRKSPLFPVTFRHLLETEFYQPLIHTVGNIGTINHLELTGNEQNDQLVIEGYKERLISVIEDPECYVIQVKGIGMDGHWGFHGAETPLDAEAGLIRVEMNPANRRQQMIDWPEFYPEEENVPRYAVTCTVALFLRADRIIDIVPQPQKEYAVLACYGNDSIHPSLPSSAIKNHPEASSYLTLKSARSFLELKELRSKDSNARISPESLTRLKRYWQDKNNPEDAESNVRDMLKVLNDLELV